MATKINLRSPYYLKVSYGVLDSASMELYIYTGEFTTDKPADPQYTINKIAAIGNNYVVFEIAELVRDYLDIEFDGDYDSQTIWVEADVDVTYSLTVVDTQNFDYIAFDGYGYFEDGINPELSRGYLQSNNIIYRLDDQNVRVPVFTDGTNSVTYFYMRRDQYFQPLVPEQTIQRSFADHETRQR